MINPPLIAVLSDDNCFLDFMDELIAYEIGVDAITIDYDTFSPRMLPDTQPNVLVVDVVENSDQLIRQLAHSINAVRHVWQAPIIFCSASQDPVNQCVEILRVFQTSWLGKPFGRDTMANTLTGYLPLRPHPLYYLTDDSDSASQQL